jgi:heme/copper-type cytochrome/quinol oxidase subunit 4
MKILNSKKTLPLLLILFYLSSCNAIGSIFKAGIWVGVIGIVIVVALILWVISKLNKK